MGLNNISLFTLMWIVSTVLTLFYLVRQIRQTSCLIDKFTNHEQRNIYKRILAIRQYEREIVLLYLTILLSIFGIASVILPIPIYVEIGYFITMIVPLTLLLSNGLLCYHSYRVHTDHDEVLDLANDSVKSACE